MSSFSIICKQSSIRSTDALGQRTLCSELHEVRSLILSKSEFGTKVLLHHSVLHIFHESGVNILLKLLSVISGALGRGLILEELVRSAFLAPFSLESIIGDAARIAARDVNLGASSKSVHLTNSLHGYSVDLEWTSYCEQA